MPTVLLSMVIGEKIKTAAATTASPKQRVAFMGFFRSFSRAHHMVGVQSIQTGRPPAGFNRVI
jgi:hypothetical protein